MLCRVAAGRLGGYLEGLNAEAENSRGGHGAGYQEQ